MEKLEKQINPKDFLIKFINALENIIDRKIEEVDITKYCKICKYEYRSCECLD